MPVRTFMGLIASTYSQWNRHNAPKLGASLAYYTLLSVAPLVILIVAICGIVFDKTTAEHDVLNQTQTLLGTGGIAMLRTLIANARQPGTGLLATLIALITLLFGASGVFIELRDSLNVIWAAPPHSSSGVRGFVRQRLVSFAMVLSLGFLLLASLLLSAALAVIQKFTTGLVPLPAAIVGEVLNIALSLFALTVLFVLIFRFVPNVTLGWRDVGVGAIVTAVLFTVGKSLLALYFTTAAVGSTYGAAGSVVAFVVWVYYSAQIFFFGAVFTRVYAESVGSRAKQTQAAPSVGKTSSLLAKGHTA